MNSSNGPGVVYSIDFASTAPGQHLNIRWTTYAMFGQTNGLVNWIETSPCKQRRWLRRVPIILHYASISNPADNAAIHFAHGAFDGGDRL